MMLPLVVASLSFSVTGAVSSSCETMIIFPRLSAILRMALIQTVCFLEPNFHTNMQMHYLCRTETETVLEKKIQ